MSGYLFGRKKQAAAAIVMVNRLPVELYEALKRELNSNLSRFADVINRGASIRSSDDTARSSDDTARSSDETATD